MAKSDTPNIDALLSTHARKAAGGTCGVAVDLDKLDAATVAKLTAAMAGADHSSAGLAKVFEALGLAARESTIARHRRAGCKCRDNA